MQELEGTATYNGDAVGAHSRTGDGISFFNGDATLTAKWGGAVAPGTIEGRISSIRVNGGPAMSQSIHLVETALVHGESAFSGGRAVMGRQSEPGSEEHAFNGAWNGSFYNPVANDPDTDADESVTMAAQSVAGTFGVTRTQDMDTMAAEDDITESFVGAFGAHRD